MQPTPVMQCPKCRGEMRTLNRNGLNIEQCMNCRGIFLDHGELEQLVTMEGRWAQQAAAPPPPPTPGYGAPAPAWGAQPGYGPGYGGQYGGYYGHHKQKSFMKMLFST